jgi:hypothetical protein
MKKLLAYSLTAVLIGYLVYLVGRHADELRGIAWGRHPLLLAGHFAGLVLMFAAFSAGWHVVVRACGGPLGWRASAATWLVPNLGKYLPGKVAMFAGRVEMARLAGVRRSATVSAMVFENVVQTLAAVPFFAVALATGFQVGDRATALAVAIFTACALALAVRPDLLTRAFNAVLKRRGREPLDVSPGRSDMAALFALEFLAWLAYAAAGVLLARALGLAGQATTLALAVTFVASWLVGFLSFITPGGLGVREVVFVALLSGSVGTGEAATLALVSRLTWTVIEFAGAGLGLALRRPA